MSLKYPKQPSSQKTTPQFLLTKKLPATLITRKPGSYVDGKWVESGTTSTTIYVNAQPLKGHELVTMPEADRAREWIKFYTTDTVDTTNTVDKTTPDTILFDGKEYEVAKTFTYKMGVLDHTKIVASLITGSLQ